MTLTNDEYLACIQDDKQYVEAFCQKYKAKVTQVIPNTEDFPAQGLIYVFHNQQGGFSIEGIKNSLEDIIEGD